MIAWLLLAATTFVQADELEKGLQKLMGPLGSDQPAERENARAALGKLVARNRQVMRMLMKRHLDEQKDLEVRASLTWAIDKTFSPDDFSLEIRFPKDSLTVREAGSSNTRFKVRLRNDDSDDEIVLIRDLRLEVIGPDGKPLKTSTFMGAGIRPSGCFLAGATRFVTIPPGHVLEWEEGLSAYESEMRVFKGYEPSQVGTYLLRFSYGFDRAAFRDLCRDKCPDHLAADKPWNRALEGKRTFEVKLVVREETAEEKEAAARHEKWISDLMDKYRARKINLSGLHEAVDKAKLDYKDRQRVLAVTREK